MVNKGIGGDVVEGLASRWTTDIIEENPDWVSIAIGINNVARASMTNQKLEDALNRFRDNYQEIISRTREETNARLILLEIFYVAEEDKLHRNYNITPYNEVIHELAEDFGSILVPVSSAFRLRTIEDLLFFKDETRDSRFSEDDLVS